MQDEDDGLVEAVLAGDTERFRVLVDRHRDRLFGVLMRLVCDPDLAEELAQEAFVRAYTGLAGFRGQSSFGTWLVQIGVNLVRDHQRRSRRAARRGIVSLEEYAARRPGDWDPPDPGYGADPLEELDRDRRRDQLLAALQRIPREYREVLVLKHLEAWPYERIADLTGDSVGTLKVRAHRARKLLREQLAGIDREEDIRGRTDLRPGSGTGAEVRNGSAD